MTTTISKQTVSAPKEPFYPVSDGEPMAETNLHWEETVYATQGLREHFLSRKDVYVASDNFLYYEKGVPSSVVSPDCYVVFGVSPDLRYSYKVWEEGGRLPSVVIEITSRKTRKEDTGRKFETYRRLGVTEYFLLDPTGDYIQTRLKGYLLVAAQYVPIEPDAQGRLYSQELDLELAVEGSRLRYYNPTNGKKLLTDTEVHELARQETQRADAEAQRAEQATRHAAQEAQRANQEAQARTEMQAQLEQAQVRLAALEKQLQEATSLQSGTDTPKAEQNDSFEN